MLVEFETKGYPTITMLGDVAQHLLRMMGMSGNVPGAVKGRDVGEALRRLRTDLHSAAPTIGGAGTNVSDDDQEPPVSLAIRAFPLLELMAVASENDYDVMWKERI